ncbi:HAD family hydrolase [Sphingopyxis sp. H038]|uniref:HAD-IA family hydrolase n=1 Tax=unclassified Sphingopyxis TaxID=2614943 RepID=UPI0007318CC3|nr:MULTISPECIES: HAD-IA family hydrolase [unclassified Sphingopyxis]KTE00330.1 HAD family hydrolase [Sphingopyxis sp. H012]KTE06677.1 HAD family hydrolase [Sphingopyxis sp. H053]KTE08824.1 HAD family hydrolase [Sphingopyxis sp. H093]KTE28806.1 HAD family hydrolase [Sphingopyxis sp. H080]KTE32723.1 HAD family hydrolase [Sphingopyxis sp. H038]
MTYTTVIFDFGGVITASPFEAFNRLEEERGLPRDFVRRVNSADPDDNAWAKFERAEIDAATFDTLFAEEARALGHDLEGEAVLAVIAGAVRPAMVAALDTLKDRGFTIACITNNVPGGKMGVLGAGMTRSEEAAIEVADIMARFAHVIESSKAGVRKPDPRIYLMMCEALGVEPGECIYLDDLGINCKPASALGMHAIKVTSGEQALADLSAVLGMELP